MTNICNLVALPNILELNNTREGMQPLSLELHRSYELIPSECFIQALEPQFYLQHDVYIYLEVDSCKIAYIRLTEENIPNGHVRFFHPLPVEGLGSDYSVSVEPQHVVEIFWESFCGRGALPLNGKFRIVLGVQ